MASRLPVVAIVGRPNVGKSTLFNRVIGERRAVVDDMPGVTRDRNNADVHWNRRAFTLVDTGGYLPPTGEGLADAVTRQVEAAIGDADLVLLVVDTKTGPTDLDDLLAKHVLRSGKPALLVANKVDGERDEPSAADFYGLAMGDPIPVSAANGRLSGDLLDRVIAHFPEGEEPAPAPAAVPRIAVVGRPNVGKSTFVNMLLGNERVVVSPMPGTTRDAIDLPMKRDGRPFVLVDTAGLRRKARAKDAVEFYSSLRTTQSLERCDVALVLVDAVEGCTVQDTKIAEQAESLGKGMVLCINKWDLVEKDHKTAEEVRKDIVERWAFLGNYPVAFTSGLTGQRAFRTLDIALEVYDRRRLKVTTSALNRFLDVVNSAAAPVTKRGRSVRMVYCAQARTEPPLFLFFTSRPRDVPEHYRRFLENRLREQFDLLGTPVRVAFRKK